MRHVGTCVPHSHRLYSKNMHAHLKLTAVNIQVDGEGKKLKQNYF